MNKIKKRRNKNKINIKKLILLILSVILILLVPITIYLNTYYHSTKEAKKYLKSDKKVKITKIKEGYYFNGKGNDKAIIFYPGAKVEKDSYSRIMYNLANNGIDCFLLEMPFNIAFFGINKPDRIIKEYNYKEYILSGHSLGGIAATSYIEKNNSKKLNTIIYLASYPNKELNNDIKLLSIYGSNDKVISSEAYKKSKENFPSNFKEYVIVGGNHANFANYSKQKGDGKATITKKEQQDLTTQYILNFLGNF